MWIKIRRTIKNGFADIRKARGRSAFTLLEVMLAIGILVLILTATTMSLSGRWQAEQGRRGAQKVMLAWQKARSYAWREGREWIVKWDEKESQLRAMPLEMAEELDFKAEKKGEIQSEETTGSSTLAFHVTFDHHINLLPEENEEKVAVVHFLANKRVRPASVLVEGPKGDLWRIRTDWDGEPILEQISGAKETKTKD